MFSTSILPCQVKSLSYHVEGRTLIDDLTFDLVAGSRTLVLGPNGAGKSLTLRLLHGLLPPSGGTIDWADPNKPQQHQTPQKRRAPQNHQPPQNHQVSQKHQIPQKYQAMVFQRPVMLRRTAAANLDYALSLTQEGDRAGRRRRRDWVLAQTGLTQLAERPARLLSIGEQQRLALARAWALEPQVLFLDEPTASLDPGATRQVEAIIQAIHASGTKIVMTTHDLGQAHRLADEIIFLHQGHLVERQSCDAFFTNPQSAAAAAFLKGELLW
ncbi:MAG: ATP-binding cassette domain-containing protein [Pseudomonadota bacterium]